jgi:hypothetical protein
MSGARPAGDSERDRAALDEQVRSLTAQVRELASLLMLPPLWRGRSFEQITAGIPEVLVTVIRADVAVLRIEAPARATHAHPPGSDLVALAERAAEIGSGQTVAAGLKMGRYMPITIAPTTPPMMTMIIGSSRLLNASTALFTSSS